MRTAFVDLRGEKVEVEYRDHGYEPDTNAHEIEWSLVEPVTPELTDEEEAAIYYQLTERSGEHDFSDVRDEGEWP